MLKNFRDDIFWKSVNWKFPLHSFILELDSLVRFYREVVDAVNNDDLTAQEKPIVDTQLIQPLKKFLLSLDNEFQTDHFFQKIKYKNAIISTTSTNYKQNYVLEVLLINRENKPQKNKGVRIYDKTSLLLADANTNKFGRIQFRLGEESYRVETEGQTQIIELSSNKVISIILPKKKHWWQKFS